MAIKKDFTSRANRKRIKELAAAGLAPEQISNAVSVKLPAVNHVLSGKFDEEEASAKSKQKQLDAERKAAKETEQEKQEARIAAAAAAAATAVANASQATAAGEQPGAVGESQDSPEGNESPLDFTEESLQAIAEADGIEGLRVIADPLGVKGTSKDGLIAGLMALKASAGSENAA